MSRKITPLGLQYSVKEFVESSTGINTLIRIDGMELPKEKPYIIVTILPSTSYAIAKGREAVQTKYSLQLDVYGESKRSISDIHYELSDLLTFGEFPYFTEDAVITDKTLEFDDEIIESPIFSDEVYKTSDFHSMHFGVSVFIVRHKRLN